VPSGVLDGARLRLERLHEDAARRVAAAAAGELGEELERALLGAEVRQAEPGVGVDDRRELDAREVVGLRDPLRPHEDGTFGPPERSGRLAQLLGPGDRVRVEPDPLELGDMALELALEPLRPGSDPRKLGRAAGRTGLVGRLAGAAVVAAKRPIPVQREGDVAVAAAPGGATGAAVEGGSDTAPVEQQDRPAALLRAPAQLGEERPGERLGRLL